MKLPFSCGSQLTGWGNSHWKSFLWVKKVLTIVHFKSCQFVVNQAEKENVEGKNMKDCSPNRQDQGCIFYRLCREFLDQASNSVADYKTSYEESNSFSHKGIWDPAAPWNLQPPVLHAQRRPCTPGPGWKGLTALWRAGMEGKVINV